MKINSLFLFVALLCSPKTVQAGKDHFQTIFFSTVVQIDHFFYSILEFLNFQDAVSFAGTNKKIKEKIEILESQKTRARFQNKMNSLEYLQRCCIKKEAAQEFLDLLFENNQPHFSFIYKGLTAVHPLFLNLSDLYPNLYPERWNVILQNVSLSHIFWVGSPYLMHRLEWPKNIRCLDVNIPYDFSNTHAIFELIDILNKRAPSVLSTFLSIDCGAMHYVDEESQNMVFQAIPLFPQCLVLNLQNKKIPHSSSFIEKINQNLDCILTPLPQLCFFTYSGTPLSKTSFLAILQQLIKTNPLIHSLAFPNQIVENDLFEEVAFFLKQMPYFKNCVFSSKSVMRKITKTGLEHLILNLSLRVNDFPSFQDLVQNLAKYQSLKQFQIVIEGTNFITPFEGTEFFTQLSKISGLKEIEIQAADSSFLLQSAQQLPEFIQKAKLSLCVSSVNGKAKTDDIKKALKKIVKTRFQHRSEIIYPEYFLDEMPLIKNRLDLHFLGDAILSKQQEDAIDERLKPENTKNILRLFVSTFSTDIIYYLIEKLPPHIKILDISFAPDDESAEYDVYLESIEKQIKKRALKKWVSLPLNPMPFYLLNKKQIHVQKDSGLSLQLKKMKI
jgi:hypothetical protein